MHMYGRGVLPQSEQLTRGTAVGVNILHSGYSLSGGFAGSELEKSIRLAASNEGP